MSVSCHSQLAQIYKIKTRKSYKILKSMEIVDIAVRSSNQSNPWVKAIAKKVSAPICRQRLFAWRTVRQFLSAPPMVQLSPSESQTSVDHSEATPVFKKSVESQRGPLIEVRKQYRRGYAKKDHFGHRKRWHAPVRNFGLSRFAGIVRIAIGARTMGALVSETIAQPRSLPDILFMDSE